MHSLNSITETVTFESGMEELKRRLELLLGTTPDAPIDESQRLRVEHEILGRDKQERIAVAGGELFNAAFTLLSEMVPDIKETNESRLRAEQFKNGLLNCMESDDKGRPRFTIVLPNENAIENLSKTLSRLLTTD